MYERNDRKYHNRGRVTGSGQARTVRAERPGQAGRRYSGRRRRRRADRMTAVLLGFLAVILAVCVGSLYVVFHTDKKDVVQASKGHQEPEPKSELELAGDSAKAEETPAPSAKEKTLIVIDPGHGGWDNGCSRSGVVEQEVNLAISLLVNEKLKDLGYETLLVREDNDTGMKKEDRVALAKEAEADLFVSIHQNSYGEEDQDNSVTGVETYYALTNEDSITLAQLIQDYVSEKTGARNRGIINQESLHVIRENTCPSCLVETGFLTNAKERKSLASADYQEKIASGIVQGIKEFLEAQDRKAAQDKK